MDTTQFVRKFEVSLWFVAKETVYPILLTVFVVRSILACCYFDRSIELATM